MTETPKSTAGDTRSVLIVGMHRSGTSLAAEILSRLGFWLGSAARLIGKSAFNPRGHFEFLPAVEFNNEVLVRAGGSWDAPPAPERVEALRTLLSPAVHEWFGLSQSWAFKDPRLCLTLPVWISALPSAHVRIIHMMRDPLACARSLTARNAVMEIPFSQHSMGSLSVAHAIALWAEYHRRAAIYAEQFGLPRLPVWYDQLVASPTTEISRIANFIGRGHADLASALECVDPALRHA